MSDLGKDTSCGTGLKTGRYVTGPRLVAEACFRRLTTPRGMLRGGEDEGNYGLDLTDLIGSVTTGADAASLPGRIESELKKDERILDLRVDVADESQGPGRAFVITIEAETNEGPFTLGISADEVTVDLIGIAEEAT